MAKVKAVIIWKNSIPLDHKLPLKIRVTNERVSGYIDTSWYASKNDFDKAKNLKDRKFREVVDDLVAEYDKRIRLLFGALCRLTGKEIVNKLAKIEKEEQEAKNLSEMAKQEEEKIINILDEFDDKIAKYVEAEKKGSASNYRTSKNHLIAFVDYENKQKEEKPKRVKPKGEKQEDKLVVDINAINSKFLKRFESFLLEESKKKGKPGKRCLSLTMTNLRTMFNQARVKYNDEENEVMRIKHYPFKYYKIVQPVSHKDRSISVAEVRELAMVNAVNSRDVLGQDIFFLIIALAGINTVDLYKMQKYNYARGKLSYNRSKTEGTRTDNAFISFKVPDEAKELIKKYEDTDPNSNYLFNFHSRYCDYKEFNRGVNKGLKHISSVFDLPYMTTYTARYTFARIADRKLGVPINDIGICLNHATEAKITEIYTGRDFDKITKIIRSVLDFLFPESQSEETNFLVFKKALTSVAI